MIKHDKNGNFWYKRYSDTKLMDIKVSWKIPKSFEMYKSQLKIQKLFENTKVSWEYKSLLKDRKVLDEKYKS